MRGALLLVLEIFPFVVNAFSIIAGVLLYFWLKSQRTRRHADHNKTTE